MTPNKTVQKRPLTDKQRTALSLGKGRPPGRLNKATVEVKESARNLVEDPEYRKRLGLRLISGNLAPAMETTLWAYAYGKPKETLALEGSVTVSASLTPTPELRAKIAALLEKFPTA